MASVPINYIEFKASNLTEVKTFYNACFGWEFVDYGSDYIAFTKASGLDGGFARTDEPIKQGVLVILYHKNLEEIKSIVEKKGGKISQDIFSFPGGQRFHFIDPAGNELAIWSE